MRALVAVALIAAAFERRTEASPLAYVPAEDGIWVIDTTIEDVTTVIPYDSPVVPEKDRPGKRAYVAVGERMHVDDPTMYVIDTTTQKVVAVFPFPFNRSGFAAVVDANGSDRLYVIAPHIASPSTVAVFDAPSGLEIGTIEVGRQPTSIASSLDGRYVYVANALPDGELIPCASTHPPFCSFTLSTIDVATNEETTRTTIGSFVVGDPVFKPAENPQGIAVDGKGAVYVANQSLRRLPPDDRNVAPFPALAVVRVVPPHTTRNILLSVERPHTDAELVAVTRDGTRGFVTIGSQVLVVDLQSEAVVAEIDVGPGLPAAMGLNPPETRLYVVDGIAAEVVLIDTTTNAVVKRIPVGPEPFFVARSQFIWPASATVPTLRPTPSRTPSLTGTPTLSASATPTGAATPSPTPTHTATDTPLPSPTRRDRGNGCAMSSRPPANTALIAAVLGLGIWLSARRAAR